MSKQFYIKQISLVWVQFPCQKQFHFTKFKCKYGLIVKNISISSYSV